MEAIGWGKEAYIELKPEFSNGRVEVAVAGGGETVLSFVPPPLLPPPRR